MSLLLNGHPIECMCDMMSPSAEHSKTKVQDLCARRRFYSVNREYQREEDIWSGEDKKYLIDSILRDFDIPKIYLRELSDQSLEIVDGQQRIDTIWKFRDDVITLSGIISGKELDGKQYSNSDDELRGRFNDYELDTVILKNYDDERVREMFTRLQRGKPLNPAEKLNAFPGAIVPAMRFLGKHEFFSLVYMSLRRYHPYLIAARMLLIQYGLEHFDAISDIGPERLYSFFDERKAMAIESREVQSVRQNLDFLYKAFRSKGEKIPELSSDAWVINVYLLVASLQKQYSMKGQESIFADFFIKFWREAEGLREMKIKPTLNKVSQDFLIAISNSTMSKEKLVIRQKELVENYVERSQRLEFIDPNRLFSQYEKVVIYRNGNGKCVNCRREVNWNEFEADHIRAWSAGGKTTLDNAQLLCRECNRSKSNL